MATTVIVTYKDAPEDQEIFNFQTASAAIEFARRLRKNPNVLKVEDLKKQDRRAGGRG